jgi:predicted RNA-binding protein YlqC (UPF0109 family)
MIAHVLVSKPEAVLVTTTTLDGALTISLTVDPTDHVRLIGEQGRTAKAIRVLLDAAAKKENLRVVLETM